MGPTSNGQWGMFFPGNKAVRECGWPLISTSLPCAWVRKLFLNCPCLKDMVLKVQGQLVTINSPLRTIFSILRIQISFAKCFFKWFTYMPLTSVDLSYAPKLLVVAYCWIRFLWGWYKNTSGSSSWMPGFSFLWDEYRN